MQVILADADGLAGLGGLLLREFIDLGDFEVNLCKGEDFAGGQASTEGDQTRLLEEASSLLQRAGRAGEALGAQVSCFALAAFA